MWKRVDFLLHRSTDEAKNVYKVNLGGGELSFSACPRVGNRPPRKKNIANPRGMCIILVDFSMHNTRLDLVLFVTLACVAGTWKWWAQEKTGAREGDTRRERERLHGRPPKIVFRPLSNYLATVAWAVKSFDRKWLTSHKQSVPPKSVVHFIFGLNISVIKISWVIWL